MKDKNEELQIQVLNWIEIAEEDLILAKHAFTIKSNIPYRLIGYHAQQCAEKYLKAYLVSKLIDFPYTHNIEVLITLCNNIVNLKDDLKDTVKLSRYAIAKRYPGEYQSINRREAKEAVVLAELTKNVIGKLLEKDGFHISKIPRNPE